MPKARIRNSTLDLYVARGGSSISITAVPEAAGAAPGLVVHHYGSKEGLRRARPALKPATSLWRWDHESL